MLLALGALNIDVLAQKKPASGDIAVTSRIQDSDPNNIDLATGLPKPFRIQSDLDSREVYTNGVDSVKSIIQGIGDWELDTKTSTIRKVFIDFGEPVLDATLNGGQTPNAPFQSGYVPIRFISKCTQQSLKLQDLALNDTKLCPLAISLDYSGSTYAVRMNPPTYYETDWIQWTCLSLNGSGKCNSWEMEPSTFYDGERKARGQLLKITTVKGKTVEEKRGVFYFSFKVNLTNP
jgi:hypothetical protein